MTQGGFLPRDPQAVGPDTTLGARITRARETAGLSTAQLARRAGIKTATLSGWETGRSEPRPNRLVTLAGILGVSPTWLIEGYGSGPPDAIAATEIELLRRELDAAREATSRLTAIIETLDERLSRLLLQK